MFFNNLVKRQILVGSYMYNYSFSMITITTIFMLVDTVFDGGLYYGVTGLEEPGEITACHHINFDLDCYVYGLS